MTEAPPTGGPLLLLDVDGVLNPDTSRNRVDKGRLPYRYYPRKFMGYRLFLSPEHGPLLLDLATRHGAELVWATTWERDANALIGPVVNLPPLPVIKFGASLHRDPAWKFDAVLAYAAGRPLAWLDDDFLLHRVARERFEAARAGVSTLLHTVAAREGLVPDDLAAVEAWLGGLAVDRAA